MLSGVKFAKFNDLDSVKSVISERTAGIIVEPVQGEGGVVPAKKEFLVGLRELADEYGALLIFDEVQTGMGRTGELFAYQVYGVEPDVMTLAKALGNGIPIGAIVTKGKASNVLRPGLHASTFGGNFLSTAAGVEVFKEIAKSGFLEEVREKGEYLKGRLNELKRKFPELLKEVRGLGLMLGVVCSEPCGEIVKLALREGLIINCTAGNVLRFLPPLVITKEEIDLGIEKLERALREYGG